MSWKMLIKCKDDLERPSNLSPTYSYTGENAVQEFISTLLKIQKCLNDTIFFSKDEKKMIFTEEDKNAYDSCDKCWLCNGAFDESCESEQGCGGLQKVRDHCHLTGKYGGAAHFNCNKTLVDNRQRKTIPFIAHNAMEYDMHLILEEATKEERIKTEKLSCILCNSQKFKTVSIAQFKFIDSMAFLSASMGTLLQALPE